MAILSVDAGIKGGAVVFSETEIIHTEHFQKKYIVTVGKDTKMFFDCPIKFQGNITDIIIEDQQPRPSDTPKTAYTIASLFSSLVLHLKKDYPNATLHFIKPQTWQSFIRANSDAVFLTSKETSIHFANKHLTTQQLVPKNCKIPHDGIADAFCLGYYFLNRKES